MIYLSSACKTLSSTPALKKKKRKTKETKKRKGKETMFFKCYITFKYACNILAAYLKCGINTTIRVCKNTLNTVDFS